MVSADPGAKAGGKIKQGLKSEWGYQQLDTVRDVDLAKLVQQSH